MKKIILLFLFYGNSALSNNEDFLIEKVIEMYPNSKVEALATGGLDESGASYIGALIKNGADEDVPEPDADLTLVLLKEVSPKKYFVITYSKPWQYYSRRNNDSEIHIDNKSIIVTETNHSGCCSRNVSIYKFKKERNDFYLVGVEKVGYASYTINHIDENHTFGTSVNYLTGVVKYWRAGGVPINNDSFDFSKNKYVEKQFKFKKNSIISISNFSATSVNDGVNREFCGGVNEYFKYLLYSDSIHLTPAPGGLFI
ncbi:hypothetical protein [Fluviicoccus keumensis]|nr:hypothetical protein [Fluviicoccus keumensis]